jgi:hypothetical protein
VEPEFDNKRPILAVTANHSPHQNRNERRRSQVTNSRSDWLAYKLARFGRFFCQGGRAAGGWHTGRSLSVRRETYKPFKL